jgi:hypothetical protein
MILKNVINKSWYGSIGYIKNLDSIDTFNSYLLYNKPILDEFKGHIFAFTYDDLDCKYLLELITSLYPRAQIILLEKNRGHNFGTTDLDNAVFDYCKENNIDWVCKGSNDVIIQELILNKEIDKADFYYLNGIGYGGMVSYNFNFNRIINEEFYPQTNFYFIRVDKIDYLYDKDYVNETYQYIQNIEKYNGKVWEYIKGWSCENFLKQCVERNNLSKHHLVSQKIYIKLLELIKQNQIHDCSHKNIMIEGICHFQYPNNNILIIS